MCAPDSDLLSFPCIHTTRVFSFFFVQIVRSRSLQVRSLPTDFLEGPKPLNLFMNRSVLGPYFLEGKNETVGNGLRDSSRPFNTDLGVHDE